MSISKYPFLRSRNQSLTSFKFTSHASAKAFFLKHKYEHWFETVRLIITAITLWGESWLQFKTFELALHHREKISKKKESLVRLKKIFVESLQQSFPLNPLPSLIHCFALQDKDITNNIADLGNVYNYSVSNYFKNVSPEILLSNLRVITKSQNRNIKLLGPSPSIFAMNESNFLPLVQRLLLRILDGQSDCSFLKYHSNQQEVASTLLNVFTTQFTASIPRPDSSSILVIFVVGGIMPSEVSLMRRVVKQISREKKCRVVLSSTRLISGTWTLEKVLEQVNED